MMTAKKLAHRPDRPGGKPGRLVDSYEAEINHILGESKRPLWLTGITQNCAQRRQGINIIFNTVRVGGVT